MFRSSRRRVMRGPLLLQLRSLSLSTARAWRRWRSSASSLRPMREASQLDGKFSAFGRVKSGMDVVDAINHAPVEGEKPVKTVQIKKATVEECEKKPL